MKNEAGEPIGYEYENDYNIITTASAKREHDLWREIDLLKVKLEYAESEEEVKRYKRELEELNEILIEEEQYREMLDELL